MYLFMHMVHMGDMAQVDPHVPTWPHMAPHESHFPHGDRVAKGMCRVVLCHPICLCLGQGCVKGRVAPYPIRARARMGGGAAVEQLPQPPQPSPCSCPFTPIFRLDQPLHVRTNHTPLCQQRALHICCSQTNLRL